MRPSGQYGYPIRRQGSSPTTWGRDTPSDQSPDGRLSTRMAQMSLSAGPLERPSRPASYSPPRVSPPVTFTWEKVRTTGEVFTPRTGHCCASVGDRIFLFGGTDGESRKCDVYCYWCTRQEWEKIQVQRSHDGQLSEPAARSGARSVVYEGIVYIFGGYTKKDGDYFNDTWAFNPLYHTWTVLAAAGDVPARRTDHSMVLYDGSIYVFGGFDGRNRYNDVYSMELPPHGAFREGSPIARWQLEDGPVIRRSSGQECPSPRFGHSAVVYGSCMYVFGGWDGHDTLNELWEFNFPSGRW
ncbi:hypothetical protein FOL47_011045 [Perkinsus chesapeaki]|uniref:Leucine-zipper-like transcriptional regulator 1 n=1 Tax=Perkinsus chesapeaki TaxID=330153 RepID=A0A7J6KYT4_PERCH|nr:hypothetical protein FOL47_011045 [Perkinsus chesapeaki]